MPNTSNQAAPELPPSAAEWLQAHGAVFVRVDADGVIEFSARPFSAALTDAVVDLLPAGRPLGIAPASQVALLRTVAPELIPELAVK